jgi:small subunit ribosomal protein S8
MDRISNMLTTIKNAIKAEKPFIEVVYTIHSERIAKVIQDKGFIKSIKVFKPEGSPFKKLRIDFEYDGTMPLLDEIKIISKPGRRIYKCSR